MSSAADDVTLVIKRFQAVRSRSRTGPAGSLLSRTAMCVTSLAASSLKPCAYNGATSTQDELPLDALLLLFRQASVSRSTWLLMLLVGFVFTETPKVWT